LAESTREMPAAAERNGAYGSARMKFALDSPAGKEALKGRETPVPSLVAANCACSFSG
jgi:hypothetical protein